MSTDLTVAPWAHNPNLLMCAIGCNDFFPSAPYTAEARVHVASLLDAHPIRMVTLSNMRRDCEVYRALVQELTQRGFIAVAQQANWTQFQRKLEQSAPSPEPTSCGCGSADCPVCWCNQPVLSEEEREAGLVVQSVERYGCPPADLAIVCPDCGQEPCQCGPVPALPELSDLQARLCDLLRRYKALPTELRPADGAELLGSIEERLRRLAQTGSRWDTEIAVEQLDEIQGFVEICTPTPPAQAFTSHRHRIGARVVGPNGLVGVVEQHLGCSRGECWYWVRRDVADPDPRRAAGVPCSTTHIVLEEREALPEAIAELVRELERRYSALAQQVWALREGARSPADTRLRLQQIQRWIYAVRCADSAALARQRAFSARAVLDDLERVLREVKVRDEPDPNAPELNQDARDRLTEQDGVQFDAHGQVVYR